MLQFIFFDKNGKYFHLIRFLRLWREVHLHELEHPGKGIFVLSFIFYRL